MVPAGQHLSAEAASRAVKLLRSHAAHLSATLQPLRSATANMGQSMSFGLTQYDVDELIAFCKGACESWRPCSAVL